MAAELAVSPHHDNPGHPGKRSGTDTESGAARHGNSVAGLVARGPEVGRPDEADVHDHGHHADSHGLLFLGLAADGATPTQNETVHSVGANSKDNHAHVSSGGVQGGGGGGEANHGDSLGCSNVPRPLIEFSGRIRDDNGAGASDEVGWAGEDKGDGGVEAEGLDHGGELIVSELNETWFFRLEINVRSS